MNPEEAARLAYTHPWVDTVFSRQLSAEMNEAAIQHRINIDAELDLILKFVKKKQEKHEEFFLEMEWHHEHDKFSQMQKYFLSNQEQLRILRERELQIILDFIQELIEKNQLTISYLTKQIEAYEYEKMLFMQMAENRRQQAVAIVDETFNRLTQNYQDKKFVFELGDLRDNDLAFYKDKEPPKKISIEYAVLLHSLQNKLIRNILEKRKNIRVNHIEEIKEVIKNKLYKAYEDLPEEVRVRIINHYLQSDRVNDMITQIHHDISHDMAECRLYEMIQPHLEEARKYEKYAKGIENKIQVLKELKQEVELNNQKINDLAVKKDAELHPADVADAVNVIDSIYAHANLGELYNNSFFEPAGKARGRKPVNTSTSGLIVKMQANQQQSLFFSKSQVHSVENIKPLDLNDPNNNAKFKPSANDKNIVEMGSGSGNKSSDKKEEQKEPKEEPTNTDDDHKPSI